MNLADLTADQLRVLVNQILMNHQTSMQMLVAEIEGLKAENKRLREVLSTRIVGVLMEENFIKIDNVMMTKLTQQPEAEEAGGEEEEEPAPQTVFVDTSMKKGFAA